LACTRKAELELGFAAKHDLVDGLEKTFSWWRLDEK